MKIVEFPQQNIVFGKNQPEYQSLPAYYDREDSKGPVVFCFELTDEEIDSLKANGNKIYFSQLTFHNPLQPVMASTNIMELIL